MPATLTKPELMPGALAHVFGVRHLSPMGAWQLRRFLDAVQPEVILIEGLDDADELIPDIVRKDSVPPIAILAYTDSMPVRTLVYPFASYSPEYQALMWAKENKVDAHFFDLPSDVFLALQKPARSILEELDAAPDDSENPPENADVDQSTPATEPDEPEVEQAPPSRISIYQEIAKLSGELDYDTYWERNFEHNQADASYRLAAFELGIGLRDLQQSQGRDDAENLVREAYMRRRIAEYTSAGIPPEKIVCVVGAYHAPVLTDEHPAMTVEELDSLERLNSKLTLMPYSYFKLSSQSGYGAGNEAPNYYQLLWEALQESELDSLAANYMTSVARDLRKHGTHRSTAAVIEGVRLSRTLSALKNGIVPTLRDLQDAAVSLIGYGQRATVAESLARIEVGTSIGSLPDGISQTSIQEDFNRELKRLKLTKYRNAVKTDLSLDLRENRTVKSEEAAFLDLNRSSFLHRLSLLGISFAKEQSTRQEGATWAENWALQWTPEAEISLVESVLLGETVELAAAFKFKTEIESCTTVGAAAKLVRLACQCAMMPSMELARQKLQELATESSAFVSVAFAASELSLIVRFGDVRRYDAQPLLPLIEELYVQGSLALLDASNCDNAAAKNVSQAIDMLNKVGQEHHEMVDEGLWHAQLHKLSDADDRNPLLSGYACAVLLESNLITNDDLSREVSRRLSPGISADLGAGWFEGMSARNRYALIARQVLWEQLGDYVASLDDEQFTRALVFLRRAFGTFSPQEKRSICENLGEVWGVGAEAASEMISNPLTEEEEQSLEDLNEFDFDDF